MRRVPSFVWPILVIVSEVALLEVLAAADVLGQLLGAARPSLFLAAVLLFFYALRLFAIFVAPGWLLFTAGQAARRWASRRSVANIRP